jgi:hypothetical protein
MSNEMDYMNQPSDQAIALFLQEGDCDKLTDLLVEALGDALRILEDDGMLETLH